MPRGFDRWVVFPGQGAYHDPEMIANGVRLQLRGHADDIVGDQRLLFLRDRPRDRPFCLLYQFKAPHRSWIPAERFARTYEDMVIADMPDFRDRGVDPALPPDERKRLNLQHLEKNYYRVLLSVDENIGRLLDALDRDGLAENTIVIYTSDNGFFLGEHGLFDKRLMYEPSIRVPMLVRFPVHIRGGIVDRYEYYEYPAEHCVRKHRGVRSARWKLIHFWEHPEEWELYDLASDPDEMHNLAGRREHARTVRDLRARMEMIRHELGEDDPRGPTPIAAPCGNGVNTGYGPP